MHTQFLTPGADRWGGLLADLDHDVYHLPEYAASCARQEDGEAIAFLAEEGNRRFFVPLIVRPIDPALTGGTPCADAASPYGFPGPLFSPGGEAGGEDFRLRATAALVEGLRRRSIISGFIRMHPLFPAPLEPLANVGQLIHHGETVSIDLTHSDEETWRHMRRNHRRDINRARQQGQVARMDKNWDFFDDFVEIYQQSMRRLAARDFYFFSRGYLSDLRETLGERLHLCVVERAGEPICAGLATETGGIVQNHLTGTREDFVAASPEKLRIDFLRQWAKARGNRVLHLGGGLGGNDDRLFAFKAGFSDRRHPFQTWRLVADQPAYQRLVASWQTIHGGPADDLSGFFPAYRKPGAPDRPGDRNGARS